LIKDCDLRFHPGSVVSRQALQVVGLWPEQSISGRISELLISQEKLCSIASFADGVTIFTNCFLCERFVSRFAQEEQSAAQVDFLRTVAL
jgi:hypothetical protein